LYDRESVRDHFRRIETTSSSSSPSSWPTSWQPSSSWPQSHPPLKSAPIRAIARHLRRLIGKRVKGDTTNQGSMCAPSRGYRSLMIVSRISSLHTTDRTPFFLAIPPESQRTRSILSLFVRIVKKIATPFSKNLCNREKFFRDPVFFNRARIMM
jgi:hypothetical protein